MSICQSCQEAARISSKSAGDLQESYENAKLLGISEFDGTFEAYLKEARKRTEYLHDQCRGGTHCFCQHQVESVVRDLT